MAFDGMLAMPDCPTCLQCEPPCIIVWDTFDGNLSFFVVTGTASVGNSELTLTGANASAFTNISHPEGEFGSSSVTVRVFLEVNQEAAVCIGDGPDNCVGVHLSRIGCPSSRLFKITGGNFEWISELRALPEEMNGEYPVKLCWQQGPEGEGGSGGETFTVEAHADATDNSDPPWVDPEAALGFPDDLGSTAGIPAATVTGSWGFNNNFTIPPDPTIVSIPSTAIINWIIVGFRCFQFGDTFEPAYLRTITLHGNTGENVIRDVDIELPLDSYANIGSGTEGDDWGGGFTGADFVSFGVVADFDSTIGTAVDLDAVFLQVNYTTTASGEPRLGRLSCNIGSRSSKWPDMVYLEARTTFSGLYAGLICVAGSARFDQFLWTYLPSIDADGKVLPGEHDGCPSCFPVCGLFIDNTPEENTCDWEDIGGNLILRHTNPESEEGLRVRVVGLPVTPTSGFKVYVDWADIDNHRYVQVISDGTSGRLHIYRVKGGVTTLIASSPATILYNGQDFIQVRICWRGDAVLAEAGGGIVQISDTETIGGTRVGLDGVSTFQNFESDSLGAECEPCTAAGNFCPSCIPGTTHHYFLITFENFIGTVFPETYEGPLGPTPCGNPGFQYVDLSHSKILSFAGGAQGILNPCRDNMTSSICSWGAPKMLITDGVSAWWVESGVSLWKDDDGVYWLTGSICLASEFDQPCGIFGSATWGVRIGTTLPDCSKLNFENIPLCVQSFIVQCGVPIYKAEIVRVSVRVM